MGAGGAAGGTVSPHMKSTKEVSASAPALSIARTKVRTSCAFAALSSSMNKMYLPAPTQVDPTHTHTHTGHSGIHTQGPATRCVAISASCFARCITLVALWCCHMHRPGRTMVLLDASPWLHCGVARCIAL
eukprot:8890158-Pyramimonas_sp.AAC.1